jgi:hypothetical protein
MDWVLWTRAILIVEPYILIIHHVLSRFNGFYSFGLHHAYPCAHCLSLTSISHLLPFLLAVWMCAKSSFVLLSRVPTRTIFVAFTRSITWRFTSVISQRKRFYIIRWQEPGQRFRLSVGVGKITSKISTFRTSCRLI